METVSEEDASHREEQEVVKEPEKEKGVIDQTGIHRNWSDVPLHMRSTIVDHYYKLTDQK